MSLTRYRIFQGMLLVWALLLVVLWVYVQGATNWGAKEQSFHHLFAVWNQYWYGVINSTIVIIPAVTGCWWTARRYGGLRSHIGRAIIFLAAGCSLWGMGNVFWFYANSCDLWPGALHCAKTVDIVYPDWPDVGYLSILPFAAAALLSLTRVLGVPWRKYVPFLWLPLGTLTLTYVILFQAFGRYVLPHDTTAEKLTSATYIGSDVILLSLSIMMLVFSRRAAGGTFFPPMLGISLGMVTLYVADMLFFPRVYFSEHSAGLPSSQPLHFLFQGYYNGDVSDLVYGISILLCTVGIFLFARAEQQTMAQMREFEAALATEGAGDGVAV